MAINVEDLFFDIKATPNGDLLYIFKYEGVKIGMVSLIEFDNCLEIANFIIKKKAYRGLGIARYVIEKIKQDYKILNLEKPLHITAGAYKKDEVLDNVALKKFYKSCGFKKINKTKEGLIEMRLRKKAYRKIEV